jgi:PAS domain S-box-containing protein
VLLTRLDGGLILEVNAQFTRLFGYAREEAIGRTTLELGLWSDPRDRTHLIERLKSEGSLQDIERNTYHRDGTVRTVLISFEPIELDGAACIIAILHDITERKLAELALRASEERFELAVRGTSDGLWDWDIVTNSVYYSPRFGELLGYAPGQMPQRREAYFDRIHPDDLPRVQVALRSHTEAHANYDVSYRVRCLDGEYRWFRSRAEAVRSADGKPMRMVGSLSDIHEHRLAEEALRRSEAEFRAIFEGSAIGIALIDTDHRILMCNPALSQFLGYSQEELCARPYGEKTHPDDRVRDQELYRELLSGQRAFLQDEKRYVHKDGHVVWGRRTVSIVRHEDGSARCAIGMVEDISKRKSVEESLRLANEREVRAHTEFTRRLLIAQEQERKRLATELHDSLGQHLSVIKNRASLALEQPAVPNDAVKHLSSILDVITAAIAEVRNLALQLRPLHIEKFGLTSSLESLLDQLADSGAVQITHRIENVDDVLHGDDATHVYRITQEALNNLLRHAQATRAGVTLERDLNCVRLSVEDNGRGFDPGAGSNGAGLGLTSIRERVALLHGSVEFRSAPGKGTRIQIELPVSEPSVV